MHKTHLLCLLAHGRYINKILNDPTVMGCALSVVTNNNVYPPKRLNLTHLQQVLVWFIKKIPLVNDLREDDYDKLPLETILSKRFQKQCAYTNRELVLMFVAFARAIGINARLVLSFRPISWKPSSDVLIKPKKDTEDDDPFLKNDDELIKKENKKPQMPDAKSSSSESKNDVKNNKKGEKSSSKTNSRKKRKPNLSEDSDDDSDFDCTPVRYKVKSKKEKEQENNKRKSNNNNGNKRKLDSKESGPSSKKRQKCDPMSEWVEVYIEEEEKWMCIDLYRNKIHCIENIRVC